MIDKLTNSHQGEFLVHTASGTVYLVELVGDKQGGFITRSPEKEDNLRSMRKDNSKLPLVNIMSCEVGAPGRFMIIGVSESDEVVTFRQTTDIVDIVDVSVE